MRIGISVGEEEEGEGEWEWVGTGWGLTGKQAPRVKHDRLGKEPTQRALSMVNRTAARVCRGY